ncbi:MAG: acetoin dehydrogenase [Waddliaceae bacterium]|nr:acetoin dehydrogenase [Waddliaceae bacterium]
MLRQSLRIRLVEEALASRYSKQEMRCPMHLSIGQEATAVGVMQGLLEQDQVFSTHRAHAHYLARGGNLKRMVAEIFGKKTGCAGGRGGSMHLSDCSVGFLASTPIVGGSLPLAVGTALAAQMDKKDQATCVFFGEACTEEGVFAESLNFAALKKLPVLFVCENNLYSVYSPLSVRQSKSRSRIKIADAHGVTSRRGDGNDLEALWDLSVWARGELSEGRGPVYLDLDTYRWREHCGPNYDNHLPYRTEEEYLHWKSLCGIQRAKQYLRINDETWESWKKELEKEMHEAFLFAEQSAYPERDTVNRYVYAE